MDELQFMKGGRGSPNLLKGNQDSQEDCGNQVHEK